MCQAKEYKWTKLSIAKGFLLPILTRCETEMEQYMIITITNNSTHILSYIKYNVKLFSMVRIVTLTVLSMEVVDYQLVQ